MLMNTINFYQSIKTICLVCAISLIVGCSSAPKKVEVEEVAEPAAASTHKPMLTEEQKLSFQKGIELIASRSYEEAELIFKNLIELHPNLAGAYVNLGVISQAQGELDTARDLYKQALKINPDNSNAAVQLSTMLQSEGKFREAEQLLLKAADAQPGNPLVNYNLGVLYELYLRDYSKAIDYYETYVETAQGDDKKKVERWIKMLERK
jgi:tetratricopeptide (TPR) repeat protein